MLSITKQHDGQPTLPSPPVISLIDKASTFFVLKSIHIRNREERRDKREIERGRGDREKETGVDVSQIMTVILLVRG
jgi:hypothetical protein